MKQIQFSTAHFFRSRVLFWCKTSHSLLCLPKTQHRKHASSHINAMLRRRRRSWRNTRSWPILWLPTCLKAMRSHDCHIGTWHQQNKILISNHQKYVKVCESSITPIFVVDTPMVSVGLWWDRMHFEDAEGQTHVGWACSRSSCASRTYQQKPTALSFWTKGVFFPNRRNHTETGRFHTCCLYWGSFTTNHAMETHLSSWLNCQGWKKRGFAAYNRNGAAFLQIHLKSWHQKNIHETIPTVKQKTTWTHFKN